MREAVQNHVHIEIRGLPSPDECLKASSVLKEQTCKDCTAETFHPKIGGKHHTTQLD